jgi:hypothetical protein
VARATPFLLVVIAVCALVTLGVSVAYAAVWSQAYPDAKLSPG